MRSKAMVLVEPGQLEAREFALPQIGEDDALLRVEATGVCGSDVAAYYEGSRIYQTPCILGHELVGRIEAIGPEAASRWGVAEGDLVVVEEYLPCGTCERCLRGDYQMCVIPRFGGRPVTSEPGLWGGYAELMYLPPQALVHKVHGDVDPLIVQLYIPIANGIYWVQEVGRTRTGDTVVIVGPGPQGLGCVIGAREVGAGKIILVGQPHDRTRLDAGLELGADHAIAAGTEEALAAITELTGGRMADTVINAAGSPAAIELSVAVAGYRATVVQVGVPSSGQVDSTVFSDLVHRLITVEPVLGRPSRYVDGALRLLESGRYPLDRLCTHVYPLDGTEEAFRAAREDSSVIRAVVVPGASNVHGELATSISEVIT